MGLFDDLPSAKRPIAAVVEVKEEEATKRVKTEVEGDEDEPAARPTAADPSQALDKIAVHIANPKKFKKAASLALALMRSGGVAVR